MESLQPSTKRDLIIIIITITIIINHPGLLRKSCFLTPAAETEPLQEPMPETSEPYALLFPSDFTNLTIIPSWPPSSSVFRPVFHFSLLRLLLSGFH